MHVQLLPLISSGGTLVGLFVAAVLVARPEGKRRANLVLSGLIFLLSLSIAHPLLSYAWSAPSRVHAMLTVDSFQFLIAPLMAWYFRVLLLPGYRLRPAQLLHALPFVLVALLGLMSPPHSGQQTNALCPGATEILWALLVIQVFVYFLPWPDSTFVGSRGSHIFSWRSTPATQFFSSS